VTDKFNKNKINVGIYTGSSSNKYNKGKVHPRTGHEGAEGE
jgi:hypothetical protein